MPNIFHLQSIWFLQAVTNYKVNCFHCIYQLCNINITFYQCKCQLKLWNVNHNSSKNQVFFAFAINFLFGTNNYLSRWLRWRYSNSLNSNRFSSQQLCAWMPPWELISFLHSTFQLSRAFFYLFLHHLIAAIIAIVNCASLAALFFYSICVVFSRCSGHCIDKTKKKIIANIISFY